MLKSLFRRRPGLPPTPRGPAPIRAVIVTPDDSPGAAEGAERHTALNLYGSGCLLALKITTTPPDGGPDILTSARVMCDRAGSLTIEC